MHPDPRGMTVEGDLRPPLPINEPILSYVTGSPERAELKSTLDMMASEVIDIPVIVGGEDILTGDTAEIVMPHDHGHVLARYHKAAPEHIQAAIDTGHEAWHEWSNWPWQDRAAVLLRAADLLAGPWRATLNASTMLGQSKTTWTTGRSRDSSTRSRRSTSPRSAGICQRRRR